MPCPCGADLFENVNETFYRMAAMYSLPPIVPEAFSHMETGSIGMYKLPPIQGSGQVGDIHFHLSLVAVTRVGLWITFSSF